MSGVCSGKGGRWVMGWVEDGGVEWVVGGVGWGWGGGGGVGGGCGWVVGGGSGGGWCSHMSSKIQGKALPPDRS